MSISRRVAALAFIVTIAPGFASAGESLVGYYNRIGAMKSRTQGPIFGPRFQVDRGEYQFFEGRSYGARMRQLR